jgi:phage baseplate assembly protein V
MGIDSETMRQVRAMLRPLAARVANSVARAVVQLADDDTKLQLVQVGVLAGETIDGAEHHQPYGFSSVPVPGAEAVVVFPSGDRSHPLVIAVSDRRYRPTGGEPGEVTVYNDAGAKVVLKLNGDIEVTPGAGGEVLISGGGSVDSLVKKTEYNAHTHATAGTGTPSPPAVPAVGTTVLKAE